MRTLMLSVLLMLAFLNASCQSQYEFELEPPREPLKVSALGSKRPNGEQTPPLNCGPVGGPISWQVLNDVPDDDATYMECVGTLPFNRAGFAVFFEDSPATTVEVTQLDVRVRREFSLIAVPQIEVSYVLQRADLSEIWRQDIDYLVDESFANELFVVPVSLTKAEFDGIFMSVSVNNRGVPLGDMLFRVSELELNGVADLGQTIAHKICVDAGFKRELAVSASIPECN